MCAFKITQTVYIDGLPNRKVIYVKDLATGKLVRSADTIELDLNGYSQVMSSIKVDPEFKRFVVLPPRRLSIDVMGIVCNAASGQELVMLNAMRNNGGKSISVPHSHSGLARMWYGTSFDEFEYDGKKLHFGTKQMLPVQFGDSASSTAFVVEQASWKVTGPRDYRDDGHSNDTVARVLAPKSYLTEKVLVQLDDVLTRKVKSQTISSVIGPFWSCSVNQFGSVSGQDRVHPKAGLLTLGQVLDFYTTPSGQINFGHFTTLKDIATNCSMSINRRVNNFHKSNGRSLSMTRQPARRSPGDDGLKMPARSSDIEDLKRLTSAQAIELAALKTLVTGMAETMSAQAVQIDNLSQGIFNLTNRQRHSATKVDLKAALQAMAEAM